MLGSGLLLLDEKGEHRVRFKPKVLCNNALPLRQFALAGQGIPLQPEGEISEDLAQGRLLELLPGFRVAPMEIHAITPQREIRRRCGGWWRRCAAISARRCRSEGQLGRR